MKKAFLIIPLMSLLFACKSKTKQDTPANLVVPGKSIGSIAISSSADSLVKVMGKPDRSDGAMGSMVNTWYAKHDTAGTRTSIFSGRDMGNPDEKVSRVKKIIVTSPEYKTKEGLTIGASLNDIGRFYGVRNTGGFLQNNKQILSYCDLKKGIGFEIDSETRKCIAINVFKVEDASLAYINVH